MAETELNSTTDDDRPDTLRVGQGPSPLPFFAEYPYFLWGEVNYDSEGDCCRPTDREWTDLYLMLRHNGPEVRITLAQPINGSKILQITGWLKEDVWLAAYLTALRSGGPVFDPRNNQPISLDMLLLWTGDVSSRVRDAERIRAMFLDPKLTPFDSKVWWGGWKWMGEFSTDLTAGPRAIMNAVQTGHADPDVMSWICQQRPLPWHREGWNYALRVLNAKSNTTENPPTDNRPLKTLPDFLMASTPEPTKSSRPPWWKFWWKM